MIHSSQFPTLFKSYAYELNITGAQGFGTTHTHTHTHSNRAYNKQTLKLTSKWHTKQKSKQNYVTTTKQSTETNKMLTKANTTTIQ